MQTHYRGIVETMPQNALAWDLAGIPVVIVGGMLLHFCFEWGGRRRVLAAFCPINESVWEHLKMAYWPLVLLTGVQLAVTEVSTTVSATLLTARAIGFYAMCVLMLGLYFLTSALLPRAAMRTRLAVDGATFVLAAVVGQVVSYSVTAASDARGVWIGLIASVAPAAIFVWTTFVPPRLELFRDQITGGYGIAAGEHRN